ncbi:MAG: hypothetical protein RID90_00540 [Marinovum algicola]
MLREYNGIPIALPPAPERKRGAASPRRPGDRLQKAGSRGLFQRFLGFFQLGFLPRDFLLAGGHFFFQVFDLCFARHDRLLFD